MPKSFLMSTAALVILATVVFTLSQFKIHFTYQDTRSMPEGWYLVLPARFPIQRKEILVFKMPHSPGIHFAEKHNWISKGVWMMKEAYGLPNDKVCIKGNAVYINQKLIANIIRNYKTGHPLPVLHFCRTLQKNEYFMMSTHIKRSFDARYFGPITKKDIIGKAIRL